MRYRRLGASDLDVSVISLGSWLTYGVGVERDRAIACVRRAFELGDQFDRHRQRLWPRRGGDPAGRGSRRRPARQLRPRHQGVRRDGTGRQGPVARADRQAARRVAEASAGRPCRSLPVPPLRPQHAAGGDDGGAHRCRESGQGPLHRLFSEWSPKQIEDALALPGVERFVSSQPQYSLLWRRPEKSVIPLCAANGVSQIVWSPLAQGVLTGKYLPGAAPPAESRAASDVDGPAHPGLDAPARCWKRCRSSSRSPRRRAASLAQFALAWVLREPNVASAIVGASRPEQLDENAAASDLEIDPALFARAEAVVASLPARAA